MAFGLTSAALGRLIMINGFLAKLYEIINAKRVTRPSKKGRILLYLARRKADAGGDGDGDGDGCLLEYHYKKLIASLDLGLSLEQKHFMKFLNEQIAV